MMQLDSQNKVLSIMTFILQMGRLQAFKLFKDF